jgi:1-acyl-sn-glycerol-3-phosphate acyltransferase
MMLRRIARILFFLAVVKPLLLVVLGLNVFGRQHLPQGQQFILIANHNSHLDTLALMNMFPLTQLHRIHPVAAGDYFLKNRLMAWFSQTFLNILPIARSNFTRETNPLTKMGDVLAQGDSLILFPEGTRGEPEIMAPFQTGIAHLIKKYPNVPVVPVFLKNMGRSLPKGEALLLPLFCDALIGPPCHFTGSKDDILAQIQATMSDLQQSLIGMFEETDRASDNA